MNCLTLIKIFFFLVFIFLQKLIYCFNEAVNIRKLSQYTSGEKVNFFNRGSIFILKVSSFCPCNLQCTFKYKTLMIFVDHKQQYIAYLLLWNRLNSLVRRGGGGGAIFMAFLRIRGIVILQMHRYSVSVRKLCLSKLVSVEYVNLWVRATHKN